MLRILKIQYMFGRNLNKKFQNNQPDIFKTFKDNLMKTLKKQQVPEATEQQKRQKQAKQQWMKIKGQTYNKQLKQKEEKLQKIIQKLKKEGKSQSEIYNVISKKLTQQAIQTNNQYNGTEAQAKQQFMLAAIKKNTTVPEIKLKHNKQDEIYQEIAIQQKQKQTIIEAMRKGVDPKTVATITQEDFLKAKYSPEIVRLAENYQKNEMKYLKNLIEGDEMQDRKKLDSMDLRDRKDNAPTNVLPYKSKNIDITQSLKTKINSFNEEGLLPVESQQSIKQKGLKQYQYLQYKDQQDRKILQAGQQDLQGTDLSEIFIGKDIKKSFKHDDEFKQIFANSSFGKQELRIKNLAARLENLGFQCNLQELRISDKQILFNQKKFRQDEVQFRKAMLKRQKKKQMKTYIEKMHEEKLRQDMDYEQPTQPGFKKPKFNPANPQQSIQQIQQMQLKKASTILDEQKQWRIHRTKTMINLTNFLRSYFHNGLFDANNIVIESVDIIEVRANQKMTVLHVFWKKKKQKIFVDKKQKQFSIKRIQEILEKKSKFIAGKMTQVLGLRYAPDIRFYYEVELQKTKELKQEVSKYKDKIIQKQLQAYADKGLFDIKNQQKRKQYLMKLTSTAEQNLRNLNNRHTLMSKSYIKAIRKKEKGQNKSKMKTEKKDNVEKLWDDIDKL